MTEQNIFTKVVEILKVHATDMDALAQVSLETNILPGLKVNSALSKPPAAPVPSEFLVFFGFNKSSLTPQALETVRRAAVAATQLGTASIRVVGHTDRAGSVSYNKALSLRRADAVKKALVAEGRAASPSIRSAAWYG